MTCTYFKWNVLPIKVGDAQAARDEAKDTAGDRMTILLDLVIFGVKICACVGDKETEKSKQKHVTLHKL